METIFKKVWNLPGAEYTGYTVISNEQWWLLETYAPCPNIPAKSVLPFPWLVQPLPKVKKGCSLGLPKIPNLFMFNHHFNVHIKFNQKIILLNAQNDTDVTALALAVHIPLVEAWLLEPSHQFITFFFFWASEEKTGWNNFLLVAIIPECHYFIL